MIKKHVTILNGIDTSSTFHPRNFKEKLNSLDLNGEKILLHVTSSFSNKNKGGEFIVRLAERIKDKRIKIIVVGNVDRSVKLPENILDIGQVKNQDELAVFYSMADLTVITSKRETFSMVCAESLSCGTPVVGFKAGAPELISLPAYSKFVEYGNMDELEDEIYKYINRKYKLSSEDVEYARRFYSKERMSVGYLKIYEQLALK